MNKKVFLVEDDSAISDIYKAIMEKSDLDVEVFSMGQDIIKAVKLIGKDGGNTPDIILLDLILPDMNGLDILKEIKTNESSKDIKVFILTNQSDVDFGEIVVRPDKIVTKANITPTQLVDVIKEELK
ncbi:MAG: response regulator [Candidatus Staskawiczbacteria bacterium]|nr:response regulator [Candidatus Staskawiczbacteria bacterium]